MFHPAIGTWLKGMSAILVIASLFFIKPSYGQQVKYPEAVYINHIMRDGCCYLTQLLKLYKDASFSIYSNDDEGDCLFEHMLSGSYTIANGFLRFFPDKNLDRYKMFDAYYFANEKIQFRYSDSMLTSVDAQTDFFQPPPAKTFTRIDFKDLLAFSISMEQFSGHVYWTTKYQLFDDHYLYYTKMQDSCAVKSSEQAWLFLDEARFEAFTAALAQYDFYQGDFKSDYIFTHMECRFASLKLNLEIHSFSKSLQHYFADLFKQ